MKSLRLIMTSVMVAVTSFAFAQTEKTDTIQVYGNCGMCERRIEKALKVDGVTKAVWNPETKLLVVSYDLAKISNDAIQKNIAAVGHDTEKYSADDNVYKKLPGCCLYERKKEAAKGQKQ